MTLFLVIYTEI